MVTDERLRRGRWLLVGVVVWIVSSSCSGGRPKEQMSVRVSAPVQNRELEEIDPLPSRGPTTQNDRDRNPGIILEIRVLDAAIDRLPSFVMTVRNTGPLGFVWDREFTAFIVWNVSTLDGTPLSTVLHEGPLQSIEATPERFVRVEPGGVLRKEFDLFSEARLFHHCRGGFMIDGHMLPVPMGFEALEHFQLPESAVRVTVTAEYEGADEDAADGFAVCFGARPETVGLPKVSVKSNVAEVSVAGSRIQEK